MAPAILTRTLLQAERASFGAENFFDSIALRVVSISLLPLFSKSLTPNADPPPPANGRYSSPHLHLDIFTWAGRDGSAPPAPAMCEPGIDIEQIKGTRATV